MKLANYYKNNLSSVGIVKELSHNEKEWRLFDISKPSIGNTNFSSTDELLHGNFFTITKNLSDSPLQDRGVSLDKVRFASPVLNPEKIFLAATNYVSHGEQQKVPPPPEPYFFTKFRNAVIGHGDPILLPRVSKKVDWEVELAVIIGKQGKYIQKNHAMEHVAGYTIANDISFRDLQFPPGWPAKVSPFGHNWVKGKGLDTSLPLGPWLVTADEIGDPHSLEISLFVNGVERQKSSTNEMVFKIDALIEYLSNGITLKPGDIISTGTPLGPAAFSGVPYLKDGDIVEAKIEKIGTLRNPVKAEIS